MNSNYEPNYVLAIRKDGSEIAVCYFDVSTHSCFLGQFDDDSTYSSLRTLLSQIRPVEIAYEKNAIPNDLVKMLKHQPTQPILNVYNADKCLSVVKV